jgi:hypothetical protein
MSELKEFIKEQYKTLDKSIVATPSNRSWLESFAKANNGVSDILLMQMSIQFGYKMAIEDLEKIIKKEKV